MQPITLIATVVGLTALVFSLAVCLVFFGYWMGRNSLERPFRSEHNPAKARQANAMDEPGGDLFNDAAYGYPGEDDSRIPTIRTSN